MVQTTVQYVEPDGMESGSSFLECVRSRHCFLLSLFCVLLLNLSSFRLLNLLDGDTRGGAIQSDLRGGKQFATPFDKREQIRNLQDRDNALEQTKLPSSDLEYLPCCYANHTRCDLLVVIKVDPSFPVELIVAQRFYTSVSRLRVQVSRFESALLELPCKWNRHRSSSTGTLNVVP